MSNKRRYLADGVYADIDELGRIVLTTEDAIRVSNTIILDIETIDALLHYLKREGFDECQP